MKFAQIPENVFKEMQLGAGVLLDSFDPTNGTLTLSAIKGATSGGIKFAATPTFIDFGEDIDNCPKNSAELKQLDSYDVKLSGNFVSVNQNSLQSVMAGSEISGNKITPRPLKTEDFKELWWVGDYSDKNGAKNGGFVAIHMKNTLSTGGFQIQTGDKAKGQFAFEYTAHYSIQKPEEIPFEVYIQAGTDEA